jgi:hypothetical protein
MRRSTLIPARINLPAINGLIRADERRDNGAALAG